MCMGAQETGDPGRSRTCNLKIRSLALYPIELRGHGMRLQQGADCVAFSPNVKKRGDGRSSATLPPQPPNPEIPKNCLTHQVGWRIGTEIHFFHPRVAYP